MALTKVTYSMINGSPVNVLDYGADPTGATSSTTAFQAAINTGKQVFVPNGTYAIGPLTLLQGTSIVGENKYRTILKPTGAADIFVWSYATSGVLFELSVDNFTINMTGFDAKVFLLNGMQYGSMSNLLFENASNDVPIQIEFAYFNTFTNIHFRNTQFGIWLKGTSYNDGPNHNVLRNINIENLTQWGIRMDFCRGNLVDTVDAEYSNNNLSSAIIFDNCSYCQIHQFWYEANTATVAAPAILIQGDTTSSNKKNAVIWSPQIIHPSVGIQIISALDCTLDNLRFVGGTINIQDDGNTNLVIINPQIESPSIGLLSTGSLTTKIITDNSLTQNANTSLTIDSRTDGFNQLIIKNAGVTKFYVTTKLTTNEVTLGTADGEVLTSQTGTGFLIPVKGAFKFSNTIASATATTNCLFVDTADGILKFKDSASVVHSLY